MSWKSGSYTDSRLGNFKMRGKKMKMLYCGCCDAFNFNDEFDEHLADREIKAVIQSGRAYIGSDRFDELPSLLGSSEDPDCN